MRLLLAALAVALAACDGNSDPAQYPGPLDLPPVSVGDLGRATAPVPGRYNVTATVAEVTICRCPDNAMCSPCPFSDGVLVSETGEPPADPFGDPVLHIAAEEPEQFRIGRRYVFSVVVERAQPTNRPLYWSDLLGYGPAE